MSRLATNCCVTKTAQLVKVQLPTSCIRDNLLLTAAARNPELCKKGMLDTIVTQLTIHASGTLTKLGNRQYKVSAYSLIVSNTHALLF